ncbi:MAG: LysR family transcriptional regulator, partial [Burkholderiaceae bacterium]
MSFRNLDLNLLRVFDAVMLERSLTRAAAKLALTQPAVSNSVARLRDALDDDLFVRSGYGVEPTARSRTLWPVIREALEKLEAAISPSDFDPATDTSSFRLAMADATATTFLPQLVRYLEAEAPGMSLRVMPLMTRDPRNLLEQGEIEIAVGYFPVAIAAIKLHSMQDDMPDIYRMEHLYGGPYVCVMRKGHPLAEIDGMSMDDFCEAHHLLVSYSGRPFGFTDQALASIGRSRRIVLTVNQFFTGGQVVINSDLLTVLPAHFLPVTGFQDQLVVRE